MRLQYQLSNGAWTDCNDEDGDRTEEFLNQCIEASQKIKNEWVKLDRDQVIAALECGKELFNGGSDWYSNCRCGDAHERIIEERRAAQPPVETVKCSCGCTVPRGLVMSASLGSSCSECYDRMSA